MSFPSLTVAAEADSCLTLFCLFLYLVPFLHKIGGVLHLRAAKCHFTWRRMGMWHWSWPWMTEKLTSSWRAQFLPFPCLLLSWSACLLTCRSSGQRERKSSTLWRWSLIGKLFLCETSLLSDLSYTYFSPFFFNFQSWQPHKSTIQMGCARDAGHHEWGISCPPGPLSLCAISFPCIFSHLLKLELCQPLPSGSCGLLSASAACLYSQMS